MHQNGIEKKDDIYRNGVYIQNNPSLHMEDAAYKFGYIKHALDRCLLVGPVIRVLDVGGGTGAIAALVCQHIAERGFQVECHAYDLSVEMLDQQRTNNSFTTVATADFGEIQHQSYDLALLIDVIEHIPENKEVATDIDRIARNIIYNIPTERNLFDLIRNFYLKGHYAMQTATLGHLHFYSYRSAKRFVRKHHKLVCWVFPDYAGHLLQSQFPGYVKQRASRLRKFELVMSYYIYRYLNPLAPWIIQGSLFILAQSRTLHK